MLLLAKQILGELNSNFVGVFLYGSQNYGLDGEGSDRDAILILKEGPKGKKQIAIEGGIVKIYTLEHFLSRLRKGDLECYEILYTKHRFVNAQYEPIFDAFVEDFTQVLNMERIKRALMLKLREHLAGAMWLISNPDNARYHRKRVYWICRVLDQFEQINQEVSFKESFQYSLDKREELLKIKNINNYLSLKQLDALFKATKETLKKQPIYDASVKTLEEETLSKFYGLVAPELPLPSLANESQRR